jgi:hypothetical protein
MQTVTTLPILQTVSDSQDHYIGLQPALSGKTNAEYVNRNISFNPASNTLNIGVNVRFLPNAVSGASIADGGITASKIGALTRLIEQAKIIPGTNGGNVNIDLLESTIYYLTGYPNANLTFNLRGNSTTPVDSILIPGQSITTVFMISQNVSQYAANISVDGIYQAANTRYLGNAKPAYTATLTGNPIIDVYSIVTMKVGANAYTILSSNTAFGTG